MKTFILFAAFAILSACNHEGERKKDINRVEKESLVDPNAFRDFPDDPVVTFSNERGNGGKALVCNEANVTSVRLLDFVEAEQRGIQISLDASRSVEELLQEYISRVEQYDVIRAKSYKKEFENFFARAAFLPQSQLKEIPDSFETDYPTHCEVKQAIINRKPIFPEDVSRQFLISKDLWDLMDNATRAGFIAHEIMYAESAAQGQENSIKARYFNAKVASADWREFDFKSYVSLLMTVSLPVFERSFQDAPNKKEWYVSGHSSNTPFWVQNYCTVRGYRLPKVEEFIQYAKQLRASDLCTVLARQSPNPPPIPNFMSGLATSDDFTSRSDSQPLRAKVFSCYEENPAVEDRVFEDSLGSFEYVCVRDIIP